MLSVQNHRISYLQKRVKPVEIKDMFIDIGASSQEEAMEWGVRPGDQVVPYFEFQVMKNEKCYLQKHGITELVVQLQLTY